jgi:hypothetical protein
MTYGTPQSGPQSTCLPIGVGLSYDELTLLSCDVHRNSQNVRLFDIQTGQLKHTISSNQVLKKIILKKRFYFNFFLANEISSSKCRDE